MYTPFISDSLHYTTNCSKTQFLNAFEILKLCKTEEPPIDKIGGNGYNKFEQERIVRNTIYEVDE